MKIFCKAACVHRDRKNECFTDFCSLKKIEINSNGSCSHWRSPFNLKWEDSHGCDRVKNIMDAVESAKKATQQSTTIYGGK